MHRERAVTSCPLTPDDLYALIDDSFSDEDAAVLLAQVDQCLECSRAMALIELEYRDQILAYLTGHDVGLPPPSRFVQGTLAVLKARLGVSEEAADIAPVPLAVQQVLMDHLPDAIAAASPAAAARRARREDEEPA